MPTLLLSSRFTDDNQALWRAATQAGWRVERAQGIRVPDNLDHHDVVLYVEALFAPPIAEALGLTLIEPEEDWLVRLPYPYRLRDVDHSTLGAARKLTEPQFVKPPNDKSFLAKVYTSGADLPAEFPDDMSVLIAEPVAFDVEYRCFALDRKLRTLSPYMRHGRLSRLDNFAAPPEEVQAARDFATRLAADTTVNLPKAIALDVGFIHDRGWAVVEANGAWGSGLYGCDAAEVLEVLRHAVVPR